MTSDTTKRVPGADIVGVSADDLSTLLDGILSAEAEAPVRPTQAAASTLPDRYSLDDLLAGLPPEPEDSEDDALLLTEIAAPVDNGEGGWTEGTITPHADEPGEEQEEEEEAAPPLPPLTEELAEADSGPAMAAVIAIAQPLPEDGQEDDVLDLTEEMIVASPDDHAPEHAEEPQILDEEHAADIHPSLQEPAAAQSGLLSTIAAVIAAHCPGGGSLGDDALPDNADALALLLADPPPMDDFAALDALEACWPKGTQDCTNRALLAVSCNLARHFGMPGKLPMASARAWRMLSPEIFQVDLARRLAQIGEFIAQWQRTQRTFLILDFGEIELIETLFEALNPAENLDLLAAVMNFKVLSNRRMGLLRRVPTRLKRQIAPLLPARRDDALVALAQTKALLHRIADPAGFTPIVETATRMEEEVDKMLKAVAAIGAPPQAEPPGGGVPLGRIG